MHVTGLLLAAGAGRRYGGPKALAAGGAWLSGAVEVLRSGGCSDVVVVVGAAADRSWPLAQVTGATVVVAEHWARGMSASLGAGLGALGEDVVAALVHLVDLPDVGAAVVTRVLAGPLSAATLRRASYSGEPGHPVLLGRDHWPGVIAGSHGDRGARDYLAAHDTALVECGDLAGGHDVDHRD